MTLLSSFACLLLELHYLVGASQYQLLVPPDMCANHHSARCMQMICCIPCRRLADALDNGVTSLATRHAIEALHALATHLPTSRDLILATGAVAKLVALLRDSCAQAHYSVLKVVPLPQAQVLCACASHCMDCACLFVSGPALRSQNFIPRLRHHQTQCCS